MLTSVAPNLWVAHSTFRVFCFKGSTKMTIIRLQDGRLFIHSPVHISNSLLKEIKKIGKVAYVVAPNNMHYLYFTQCLALFPKARGYVTQSLVKKKPFFKKFISIEALKKEIGTEIAQVEFKGHTLGETIFFHKSSKTLLVTDLLYNLQANNLWFEKWVMWLFGAYGRPSIPVYHKVAIKDKRHIKASVDKIMEWPIQRVIMAHGRIISGVKARHVFKDVWYGYLGISSK